MKQPIKLLTFAGVLLVAGVGLSMAFRQQTDVKQRQAERQPSARPEYLILRDDNGNNEAYCLSEGGDLAALSDNVFSSPTGGPPAAALADAEPVTPDPFGRAIYGLQGTDSDQYRGSWVEAFVFNPNNRSVGMRSSTYIVPTNWDIASFFIEPDGHSLLACLYKDDIDRYRIRHSAKSWTQLWEVPLARNGDVRPPGQCVLKMDGRYDFIGILPHQNLYYLTGHLRNTENSDNLLIWVGKDNKGKYRVLGRVNRHSSPPSTSEPGREELFRSFAFVPNEPYFYLATDMGIDIYRVLRDGHPQWIGCQSTQDLSKMLPPGTKIQGLGSIQISSDGRSLFALYGQKLFVNYAIQSDGHLRAAPGRTITVEDGIQTFSVDPTGKLIAMALMDDPGPIAIVRIGPNGSLSMLPKPVVQPPDLCSRVFIYSQ